METHWSDTWNTPTPSGRTTRGSEISLPRITDKRTPDASKIKRNWLTTWPATFSCFCPTGKASRTKQKEPNHSYRLLPVWTLLFARTTHWRLMEVIFARVNHLCCCIAVCLYGRETDESCSLKLGRCMKLGGKLHKAMVFYDNRKKRRRVFFFVCVCVCVFFIPEVGVDRCLIGSSWSDFRV